MKVNSTFKLNLIMACTSLALTSMAQSAYAEEVTEVPEYTLLDSIKQGKPMTSFRLRYEAIDQDGFQVSPANTSKKLEDAKAFTLRSLIGWQTAPFHNFSFAAQITDVHAFTDDYNDRRDNLTDRGNSQYPNVVDPTYTDLNQLYVDWTGIKNTKLRLGRQQVNLDNVRFIGDIAFRQNMQVFDGISVLNKSIPNTEVFVAHFNKVRQINTQLRDGNIDIVNAKYRISPSESVTGYGYFIDVANLSQNNGNPVAVGTAAQGGNGLGASQDATKTATTDASSKTFGVRLDGVHKIDDNWKALYTAEYAKQDDYKGGNPLIDAHYYKVGGGAMFGAWSLRIDQEVLSSNNGKYAFQTPLGTNHLFQGWSDHFLATPRQGMEDTFVTLAGSIEKAKFYAEYHVFKSDEKFATLNSKQGDKYGTEFDASVAYPFTDKVLGKLEYAKFSEDDVYGSLTNAARKGDKEIIWATAMYTF
ncbi:MAG: alginate export family protein [Methylotenera sp.]|uniref:alginate export family protein n=1 Tax=Methylotenera sp. TaxID=2051956 RepID=UPI002488C439|nr:alginate export family protein [Methylotenera sp.]MDI1308820.1 alginate export family protein [Methylotenera sp.]